ncbi:hypothetical protein OOZ15_03565 [Galbibacter sp. EGI 63066]|uniref:hypothetical protein n=1 Tax=Galbibacter sp. EGI 63066 TaxID=2993559 RepID=UPI0022499437|nr:hypothetical protein [Galbibacter sp. EGI 63066]MCX2679009.1 hypothetical protein [Galbibacter sp. EGI 63066]
MSIIEATKFFQKLLKEANSKGETRIYNDFIIILDQLKSRDFTAGQLSQIEDQIKILNLKFSPENKKRYFSKKLNIFKQFLKDEFSLITEGYYTTRGIILGMSIGACFGITIGSSIGVLGGSISLALGLSLGMGTGMTVGLLIGRNQDLKAEKQNRIF